MTLLSLAVASLAGLLLVWLTLLAGLYVAAHREDDQSRFGDVLHLAPDVLRLIRGLASDPTLPRSVKWRLSAIVLYLILPIDLVPDFIPVIGYADDALLVALGLRWVVRAAGVEAIDRHWTGTPTGLAVVKTLSGLRPAD
ncbi:YkvA family protein [Nocardioides sp.]|uniref:YkvA family protein n=1 Tax=Nocardioides sp. TaxID=35761 RepID=UPI0039C969DE